VSILLSCLDSVLAPYRVFVAEYQVRLPTEESIKQRLEELAQGDDVARG